MEHDERIHWIESRIQLTIKSSHTLIKTFFNSSNNRNRLFDFTNNGELRLLHIFQLQSGELSLSHQLCTDAIGKCICFIKYPHINQIHRNNINHSVFSLEFDIQSVTNLFEYILRHFYLPRIMAIEDDRVMMLLQEILNGAYFKFDTSIAPFYFQLAPPLIDDPSLVLTPQKFTKLSEKVVISWNKIINKYITLPHKLAIDSNNNNNNNNNSNNSIPPSSTIKMGAMTVIGELEYWNNVVDRLQTVETSLNTDTALIIISHLELHKSPLEYQIRLTMQKVDFALLNAREVLLYLKPLGNWLSQLTILTSVDSQVRLLAPICKLLLLIWDNSTHYQSSSHFNTLLQQVIDLIVCISRSIVEDTVLTNPAASLTGIKHALLLSTSFRGNYVDYKAKADQILSDKMSKEFLDSDGNPIRDIILEELPPFTRQELSGTLKRNVLRTVKICKWPARNSLLFSTFTKYIDRYRDVLELIQTILGFEDLKYIVNISNKVQLSSIDNSILFLYDKFQNAIAPFRTMDLFRINRESGFAAKFFAFRLQIKELESNLATILKAQVFTTESNFSLFRKIQLFRGTLNRLSVQSELKGTLNNALTIIYRDLQTISKLISNPQPLHYYLPQSLSVRFFYRAVQARLNAFYNELNYINIDQCISDLKWNIRDEYSQQEQIVISKLNKMQVTLTDISFVFNLPLLILDSKDSSLRVNMPTEVVDTVYEVNYSHIFNNISVPSHLLQQVGRFIELNLSTASQALQHICIVFNKVDRNTDEPYTMLFTEEINRSRTRLYAGLNRITWESIELANFLQQTKSEICDTLLPKLIRSKCFINSMLNIINSWSNLPLDVFSIEQSANTNSTDIDEDDWVNENSVKYYKGMDKLITDHKSVQIEFERVLSESKIKISNFLDSFFEDVEINSDIPQWQDYIQHIDGLLLTGLRKTTQASFSSIQYCIASINSNNPQALIRVNLMLSGREITYYPSFEPTTQMPCLSELITEWTDSYTHRCVCMKPLNPTTEDFLCQLRNDLSFNTYTKKLLGVLKSNFRECDLLLEVFNSYSYLWLEDIQTSFKGFASGLIQPSKKSVKRSQTIRSHVTLPHLTTHSSIHGFSEVKFLYPDNPAGNKYEPELNQFNKKLPTLDDFESQISIYYETYKYLKSIPRYNNLGLISVDTKPVVDFLLTLCSKWIFIYCDFLQARVESVISEIDKFIAFISPQLDLITGQECDIDHLSSLMMVFHHMAEKRIDFEVNFTPLQRCISILSKFNYSLPSVDEKVFKELSQDWELLKNAYKMAKQRIRPQIKSISDKLEDDLKKFQQNIDTLEEKFNKSHLFNYDCPLKDAKEFLEEFHQELETLENYSHDLVEFQDLLECSYVNFGKLELMNRKLDLLLQVWRLADEIFTNEKNLKRIMWQKLECGSVSANLEYLLSKLTTLPPENRNWEIAQCLIALLEDIISCLPLLELLSCQALRDRHWKQLLRVVPKPRLGSAIITETSMLTKLSFGKLHKLGLHRHMNEVNAIIVKAEEEVEIEYLLQRFEEYWTSRVFEFDNVLLSLNIYDVTLESGKTKLGHEARDSIVYSSSMSSTDSLTTSSSPKKLRSANIFGSRSSGINNLAPLVPPNIQPISLLTGIEELFQTIEDDLLEIEGVLSSSASISFIEDLKHWQTKFQRIDTVMKLWATLQEAWVGLNEVFSWHEVRSQMIQETTNFMNIDKQWRNIVKEVRIDANILGFCLKKDTMTNLEEIQVNLDRCRKSLYKHFESTHHRFPRFFFLSTNDILQIICQGNDPKLLSNYMYKLFPGIYTLKFCPLPKSSVQRIIGVTSSAGSQLDFQQDVICEEKVEMNLIKFSDQLRETLTSQYILIKQLYLGIISSESIQLSDIGIWIVQRVLRESYSSEVHLLGLRLLLTSIIEQHVASDNYQQLKSLLSGIQTGINYIFNILQDNSKLLREVKVKEVTAILSRNASLLSLPISHALQVRDTTIPCTENMLCTNNSIEHSTVVGAKVQLERIPLDASKENLAQASSNPHDSIITSISIENLLILFLYYSKLLDRIILNEKLYLKLIDTFEWYTTIKFKSPPAQEQKCLLELAAIQINYGFEYQGDYKEIILTPSSEKCLFSLIQAMKIASGSCISGLQCSGKIATLREFSYIAGRPFYEICCTEQTDKEVIYKHFQGLTQSNSILCFRYLDKLKIDVLSVLSETIKKFYHKHLVTPVSTNNLPITHNIISYGACFATIQHGQFNVSQSKWTIINQVFKKYTLVPDPRIIIEILIYTHRFYFIKEITDKLDKFYQICQTLFDANAQSNRRTSYLSLFKLKHIIFVAVDKLRSLKSQYQQREPDPESEAKVLRRNSIPSYARRRQSISVLSTPLDLKEITSKLKHTMNRPLSAEGKSRKSQYSSIPKTELLNMELLAFSAAIEEYFPNLFSNNIAESSKFKLKTIALSLFPTTKVDQPAVQENKGGWKSSMSSIASNTMLSTYSGKAIQTISSLDLDPSPAFLAKVYEVWNSLKIHHMICILGPCSSGKSSALKVCSSLFCDQRQKANHHFIFPQALEIGKLFGCLNVKTSTWEDGILPNLFRILFKVPLGDEIKSHNWFILDGDLHEIHCDVLSTIDLESYSICLPSQNKAKLYPNSRIIIESVSAEHLTPSLSAKLGFVYFNNSSVNWENIANAWLNKRNNESKNTNGVTWNSLIWKYLPLAIHFIYPDSKVDSVFKNKITNSTYKQFKECKIKLSLSISTVSLTTSFFKLLDSLLSGCSNITHNMSEILVNFSAVWSIGGCLDTRSCLLFNRLWRECFTGTNCFPSQHTVWHYIPDYENECFIFPPLKGANITKASLLKDGLPFIPTLHSQCFLYVLETLHCMNKPILVSGKLGCGKSRAIDFYLSSLQHKDYEQRSIIKIRCNMSSRARELWDPIQKELIWKFGNVYVPKDNKKLECIIEDLNYSSYNSFYSLPEALRWLLSCDGSYDFNTGIWKSVELINCIVTCNSQSIKLNSRLMKYLVALEYPYPDVPTQVTIFQTILSSYFKYSDIEYYEVKRLISLPLITNIVSITVELQHNISSIFHKTEARALYNFSLRDMEMLFRRICIILDTDATTQDLVTLWNHELYWNYSQRLSSSNDRSVFTAEKSKLVNKYLIDFNHIQCYVTECQPRSILSNKLVLDYNQISMRDYMVNTDYAKQHAFLTNFMESCSAYPFCSKFKLPLYNSIIDTLNRLCFYFVNPTDISNVILLGNNQNDTLVNLAATLLGFSVGSIRDNIAANCVNNKSSDNTIPEPYDKASFDSYIKEYYIQAGLKNKKTIIFLTNTESHDYLLRAFEFVDHCYITHLFSMEQQGNIVNGLRSFISQKGKYFTEDLAWETFLENIQLNVRFVISLNFSNLKLIQFANLVPSLFNRMQIINILPWTKSELISVTKYFLTNSEHAFGNVVTDAKMVDKLSYLLAMLHLDTRSSLSFKHNCLPGNDSFQQFVITFLQELNLKLSERNRNQKQLRASFNKLEEYNNRLLDCKKEIVTSRSTIDETNSSCCLYINLIGQQTAIIDQNVIYTKRQLQRIKYLTDLRPKVEDAYSLAKELRKNHLENINDVIKLIVKQDLITLKLIDEPDQIIITFINVFVHIFKPSEDVPSWPRGIRRLLSNVDRFLNILETFHQNSIKFQDSTLYKIEDMLLQEAFSILELSKNYNSYLPILPILVQWISTIYNYYKVDIGKVQHIHSQLEVITNNIKILEDTYAESIKKIDSQKDTRNILYKSLYNSTAFLSTNKSLYDRIESEVKEHDQFQKSLSGLPDIRENNFEMTKYEMDLLIASLVLSVGYICYIARYSIENQIALLLHVWPDTLNKLGINFDLNNSFSDVIPYPIKLSSNVLFSDLLRSITFNSTFIYVLKAIQSVLSNRCSTDFFVPFTSAFSQLTKYFVNSLTLRWSSFEHSSPFPLSLYLDDDKTHYITSNITSTTFNLIRDALSKGSICVIKNTRHDLEPILISLTELPYLTSRENNKSMYIQLAGRTVTYNREFKMLLTRITPYCVPHKILPDVFHLNLTPNPILFKEVLCHRFLTKHCLYKTWNLAFTLISDKTREFISLHTDLIKRMDSAEYRHESTDSGMKLPHYEVNQLMPFFNSQDLINDIYNYFNASVTSVVSHLERLCNTAALVVSVLSSIQEIEEYYYFDLNILYAIAEDVFSGFKLYFILPSNLTDYPKYSTTPNVAPTTSIPPPLPTITTTTYDNTDIKAYFEERLIWPDDSFFPELNPFQDLTCTIDNAQLEVLHNCNLIFKKYLKHEHKIVFASLLSLATTLHKCDINYSTQLINAILDAMLFRELNSENSMCKLERPEWVQRHIWLQLLVLPFSNACCTTLYTSITDQHVEWQTWINNEQPSFKQFPIPLSMNGLDQTNCLLYCEAILIIQAFYPGSILDNIRQLICDTSQESLLEKQFMISEILTSNDLYSLNKRLYFFILDKKHKVSSNLYTSCFLSKSLFERELNNFAKQSESKIKSYNFMDSKSVMHITEEDKNLTYVYIKNFEYNLDLLTDLLNGILSQLMQKGTKIILLGTWQKEYEFLFSQPISIIPIENVLPHYCLQTIENDSNMFEDLNCVALALLDSLPISIQQQLISNHSILVQSVQLILVHTYLLITSKLASLGNDRLCTALNLLLSTTQHSDTTNSIESILIDVYGLSHPLHTSIPNLSNLLTEDNIIELSQCLVNNILSNLNYRDITLSYSNTFLNLLRFKLTPFDEQTRPLVVSELQKSFSIYDNSLPICLTQLKETIEQCINLLPKHILPLSSNGNNEIYPLNRYVIEDELLVVSNLLKEVNTFLTQITEHISIGYSACSQSLLETTTEIYYRNVPYTWKCTYSLNTSDLFTWLTQLRTHYEALVQYGNYHGELRIDLFRNPECVITSLLEENITLLKNDIIVIPAELYDIKERSLDYSTVPEIRLSVYKSLLDHSICLIPTNTMEKNLPISVILKTIQLDSASSQINELKIEKLPLKKYSNSQSITSYVYCTTESYKYIFAS